MIAPMADYPESEKGQAIVENGCTKNANKLKGEGTVVDDILLRRGIKDHVSNNPPGELTGPFGDYERSKDGMPNRG